MINAKYLLVLAAASILAACAHPIVISPDPGSLPTSSEKISKNIGFVITAADRGLEVTSPGGGGDNVSYLPYRDLEFAIYSTLSSVFTNAVPLTTTEDKNKISSNQLNLIFVPTIKTTSSSESIFTWPPTFFSIMIDYKILDPVGALISSGRAMGEGRAEFSEFKSDFGLSAKRAGTDVFIKLKDKLLSSPELKN